MIPRAFTPILEKRLQTTPTVGADRAFVACAVAKSHPLADGMETIGVLELAKRLARA